MAMISWWRLARFSLLLLGTFSWVTGTQAATYYVSPSGSDVSAGTLTAPFATLQKAHGLANPGDTIYMRGGTYPMPAQTSITRSGTSGNPIRVFNYPGEVPVLDGSSNPNSGGHSIIRVNSGVAWWHFKGLETKSSPGYGFYLVGTASNIIIELCNVHHNLRLDNSGGGIQVEFGSNNLILNNDLHHNGHAGSEGGSGSDISSQLTGNIFRGNRVWRNNDNGMAFFSAANVLIENNWVWENGYNDALTHSDPGDGVGLKLAGGGAGGNHIVRNNVVWKNYGNGIDDNSAVLPMTVYNNTAWGNATAPFSSNFAFYSPVANVLKNNLAFSPNAVSFNGAVQHSSNSWNLPVTVSTTGFVSLDFSGASGPRQADGSLPVLNFLKLAAASAVIDKGVNVGIAYSGSAPDLGAYEYGADTTPPADTQAPTAPTSLTATAISTSQIDLSWNASTDNVGVVGYDVYRDGVKIGTTATTNYSSTGLTAATTYSYTVRAFDAAGNSSAPSTSVSGTSAAPPAPPPDATAPTVSIASPTGGTVANTIPVSVNASDNVGVTRVDLRVNNQVVGTTNSAPYQFPWNTTSYANGAVSLTAVAYDAAGNSKASAAVSLNVSNGAAPTPVDTTPPTVSIASPTGGNVSGIVTVFANASDNVGVTRVDLRVNNVVMATTTGPSPYQFTWNSTAYPNGAVSLTAVAYDAAGNSRVSSAVSVNVANGGTTAPSLIISDPVDGAMVTGFVNITASATASSGGITQRLYIDDVLKTTVKGTALSYRWNAKRVAPGAHKIRVIATNAAGNSTTKQVQVTRK